MPLSSTSFSSRAEAIELWLLAIMLFVLPTFEAPKSLALVLYLAVWAARRGSAAALRRFRPDAVELALIAMLAAVLASTLANWPYPNGTKGLVDALRYVLLFWCIYRAGYRAAQQRMLAHAITWGVLAGLAYAVFELAAARRPALELHSAGVVTQSAMYVTMAAMLAFGMALVRGLPRDAPLGVQRRAWPWGVAFVLLLLALLVMASRGALLALVPALLVVARLVNRAKLWAALAVGAALVAGAGFLVVNVADGGVAQSLKERLAGERLAQSNLERMENYRIALAQIGQGGAPWLGIGPRNYRSIELGALRFDPPLRLGEAARKLNHAHNLFLTKLVEEGVVGLAAFLAFWGLVAQRLYAAWRADAWYAWHWIAAWGAAAVSLVAGSVNTPFYQEHAMLAMALLALHLGARRAQAAPHAQR